VRYDADRLIVQQAVEVIGQQTSRQFDRPRLVDVADDDVTNPENPSGMSSSAIAVVEQQAGDSSTDVTHADKADVCLIHSNQVSIENCGGE
jgi:hypothetical protein